MHTSKADAINSTYEIYGKYHLEVYDVSDIAINNMQMSSLVKDYLSINQQIHSYNEYDFRIVYSNEKYVDFTNVKLVQGKFPENANEVLTEKWFLFQLGLDENNMIGSKIVLPDFTEESEVKKEYVVSGLITENTVFESYGRKNDPILIFAYHESLKENSILLQFHDVNNYKKHISEFVQTYDLNDNNYSENFNLITALGMGDIGKDIKIAEKIIFLILSFVIFIASAITIYNSVNILLNKCIETIGILKALGTAAKDINISILLSVIIVMILGNITGLGLGIFISKGLMSYVFQSFKTANQFNNLVIPTQNLLLIILAFIIIGIFAVLPLLYRLTITTPANILKGIKTGIIIKNKIKNRKKRLFPDGTKTFCLRLAFNNIGFNKTRQIITVLSLAISIFLLVTVIYFIKTNRASFGNHTDMDYRIEFVEKEFLSETEKDEQRNIFNSLMNLPEDYFVYPCYEIVSTIKMDKSLISSMHKEYLIQNSGDRMIFEDKFKTVIEVPVVVLGYSDRQIRDLFKMEVLMKILLLMTMKQ